MTVVMVGGGLAGLAGALFLARRGVDVTLIERDLAPADESLEGEFNAVRRGAPQARQSHLFLARCQRVLAREAPDLLDALSQRGAVRAPLQALAAAGEPCDYPIWSRRSVYEGVLRRAVQAEPKVSVVRGAAVRGLVTEASRSGVPRAVGVELEGGRRIRAGSVVDAGGRLSRLPAWLAAAGARPPVDRQQDCGVVYHTRWYRLRPGQRLPAVDPPVTTWLPYATAIAFGADNGMLSLTAVTTDADPLRPALRDPQRFERFIAALPQLAPWLRVGEPTTDVLVMGKIENRWRRLVDAEGPIVAGLVTLGDATLHTDPTFARGTALALTQAQHLADAVGDAVGDPLGAVERWEHWAGANVGPWYELQVAADGSRLSMWQAGAKGEALPAPNESWQLVLGLRALASIDPAIGLAYARVSHLLSTPGELLSNAEVRGRVRAHLATAPLAAPPPDLTRADFEALMA